MRFVAIVLTLIVSSIVVSVSATQYNSNINLECVASSGFSCLYPTYGTLNSSITFHFGQNTGVSWSSFGVGYAPQGVKINQGIPEIRFYTANISSSSNVGTSLESGSSTQITIPTTGLNATGALWACYVTSGLLYVGNGCVSSNATSAYYVELASVSVIQPTTTTVQTTIPYTTYATTIPQSQKLNCFASSGYSCTNSLYTKSAFNSTVYLTATITQDTGETWGDAIMAYVPAGTTFTNGIPASAFSTSNYHNVTATGELYSGQNVYATFVSNRNITSGSIWACYVLANSTYQVVVTPTVSGGCVSNIGQVYYVELASVSPTQPTTTVSTSTFTTTVAPTSRYTTTIPYTSPTTVTPSYGTFTLTLTSGWNLFSIPLLNATQVGSTCSVNNIMSPVWQLTNGGYSKAVSVEGGNGYWIKVATPCNVTFSGTPMTISELPNLVAGWNIIGGLNYTLSFSDIIGTCNVISGPFGFDSATNSYYNSSNITPSRGYFVKVSSACSLGSSSVPPPP